METTVGVTGMTCQHCVASVTEELEEIENVRGVDVDLKENGVSAVTITSDGPLNTEALAVAIHEAGYELAE